MNAFGRMVIAMVAAVAAHFASSGTSHAGLDDELSRIPIRSGR